MTLLTFIIPVRHHDNASDWPALKAKLEQTMRSIASQDHGDWRGIVVANEGSDLPPLPPSFSAVRVHFPPNDMHELGQGGVDAFHDAFRMDKGRRVLSGMLAARETRFFMIVDDDDFVSSRIAGFVHRNQDAPGWVIDRGYIWDDGGRLLFATDEFNAMCGTSLIVRADQYGLPASLEDASVEWIKTMLGSHRQIGRILKERKTPLVSLPFRGAIYRVGHATSHSKAPTILRRYLLDNLRYPRTLLRNASRLRWLNAPLRSEFFGEAEAGPAQLSVSPRRPGVA